MPNITQAGIEKVKRKQTQKLVHQNQSPTKKPSWEKTDLR